MFWFKHQMHSFARVKNMNTGTENVYLVFLFNFLNTVRLVYQSLICALL
jgi:hypothetical protein